MRGKLTTGAAATLSQHLAGAAVVRRGNPKAAVEIIEISEFQCPTCARSHQQIEPIVLANLSRINYARIDLPLFEHHEWAIPAAMAAQAVQRIAPSKYWQFADETFKNQEAIGAMAFERYFEEFAAKYRLDWPALREIYGSASERRKMLDQISTLFSLGIASTPTYIVNGRIMGFGPDGSFTIAAIKAALAAAPR
jgi:protein-disulfide isomerase